MSPQAEIVNTGSELLCGRVLNTHQQWLGERLSNLGFIVRRQTTVPDTAHDIESSVREALSRSDLVVTTGGLGPTSDDLTRDSIARLVRSPLRQDPETLRRIVDYFARRRRPCPRQTHVQALVPESAVVLPNDFGTAPGLLIPVPPDLSPSPHPALLMLPGPPRELHPLFQEQAEPALLRTFPNLSPTPARVLRSTGIGESALEERLQAFLPAGLRDGLEIAFCARPGEVDLRLTPRTPQAIPALQLAEQIVLKHLGRYFFAADHETLEETVVRLLRERRLTLALAESCTGGFIAHRITNVPGASEVFLGSCVTYANSAKSRFLGVHPETLETHGAVSSRAACEMADGTRRAHQSDFALAVTGIAGPGGGSPEKPVGTVHIALATPKAVRSIRMINAFDRLTFKQVTSQQALNWLRRRLLRSLP